MTHMPGEKMTKTLQAAIAAGDVEKVAALIQAGADIQYLNEHGCDALIDAVHGRDVLRDPQLLELLRLLIGSGVSLNGMSSYGECAIRVVSRIGRFDAVRLLLDAGANAEDVKFTPLIAAVAFGPLADVKAVVETGVDLEERDWWERTAWLVAIQTGDVAKAKHLIEHGSQVEARGRCGKPPLFYAIENGHIPMLRWLLEIGLDVHQTDDFGSPPLQTATKENALEAVEVLLQAGADVGQNTRNTRSRTAISYARGREVALRLLASGADPQELSREARRAILGFGPDPDMAFLDVPVEEFRRHRTPRFGLHNPEEMDNPFWQGMIRAGLNAYQGTSLFGERWDGREDYQPTWCAQRFGQSLTFLPDGRIVQIGGEHEDGSDPDFCIYNDVFVHDPAGDITIYGYPDTVFPPTDFHTATLVGGFVYVIGSLGYHGTRRYGHTPVCRLDVNTFQMERMEIIGDGPGWIYKHQAILSGTHEIQVIGGKIVTKKDEIERHSENVTTFVLDIKNCVWRVA